LDDNLLALLGDLDGALTPDEAAEETLVQTLDWRLGYAQGAILPSAGDEPA
jgi:hypothetical protein